nr:retrovirus-related Pol polyprotein from transposon TNT 1-94 [Tanacetum cinerariifolium]
MSKQCTKPRRKRDAEWFKDNVLLVQAQVNGQVLQEEELEFLADLENESFEKRISILKNDLQKEESRNIDRELPWIKRLRN